MNGRFSRTMPGDILCLAGAAVQWKVLCFSLCARSKGRRPSYGIGEDHVAPIQLITTLAASGFRSE